MITYLIEVSAIPKKLMVLVEDQFGMPVDLNILIKMCIAGECVWDVLFLVISRLFAEIFESLVNSSPLFAVGSATKLTV